MECFVRYFVSLSSRHKFCSKFYLLTLFSLISCDGVRKIHRLVGFGLLVMPTAPTKYLNQKNYRIVISLTSSRQTCLLIPHLQQKKLSRLLLTKLL